MTETERYPKALVYRCERCSYEFIKFDEETRCPKCLAKRLSHIGWQWEILTPEEKERGKHPLKYFKDV